MPLTHAPVLRRDVTDRRGHRLLQLGFVLFLLGLVVGFAVPVVANPRMGLTSHMQGILNGIFLLVLGALWPRFALAPRASAALFWLAAYGTFANWGVTLLAAFWGAGRSMPIAARGGTGTALQEGILDGLLISLSLAMIGVCVLALWGLRGGPEREHAA